MRCISGGSSFVVVVVVAINGQSVFFCSRPSIIMDKYLFRYPLLSFCGNSTFLVVSVVFRNASGAIVGSAVYDPEFWLA